MHGKQYIKITKLCNKKKLSVNKQQLKECHEIPQDTMQDTIGTAKRCNFIFQNYTWSTCCQHMEQSRGQTVNRLYTYAYSNSPEWSFYILYQNSCENLIF